MMGNLINTLLAVTVVALGILAVKVLLGTRITPKGHMLLWLALAAVMVTAPFAHKLPESELSARKYIPQVAEENFEEVRGTQSIAGVLLEDEDRLYEVMRSRVEFKVPLTGQKVEKDYLSTPQFVRMLSNAGMTVWLTGTSCGLVLLIVTYMRNRRRLTAMSAEAEDERLAAFQELKEKMKIRGHVRLRTGADSTMLALAGGGPTVFIEDEYEGEELKFVLAHELTHYRHGDLIWNLAAALIICLLWWNPVIWIAFRRFRRDMEVYCDYDAVKVAEDKKRYATLLVKAAAGKGSFIPATTSLIGGEKEVSARVKALAAFKKPKVLVTAVSVILLGAVILCLLLNPETVTSEKPAAHPDMAGDFGYAQLYEVRGNIYTQLYEVRGNIGEGKTSYSSNAEMCSGLRRYLSELLGASFSLAEDEEREWFLNYDYDAESYSMRFQLLCDYGGWFELAGGEPAYVGHGKDDTVGAGSVWLVYPERDAVYKCTDEAVAQGIAKHTRELFATKEQPPANTDGLKDEDYLAVRCKEPYEICTADRTYEEALEMFKADYVDFSKRYGMDKAEEIYNRYSGTCLEHKDSRITKLRIDKVSKDKKAVLFYFGYQRTFLNDIGSVMELWAGGGMDSETNDDGTTTYTEGQLGYIINDGNHWTYYAWSAVPQDIDIEQLLVK